MNNMIKFELAKIKPSLTYFYNNLNRFRNNDMR